MPSRAPGVGLRVVTINTWKGDGPYRRRLEVLADQLGPLDADVIACQEALVSLDGCLSTPRALADHLGMLITYHGVREKLRTVEGEEVMTWSGLATLSRWPIIEVVTRPLPTDPADGDRSVLLVALETPMGVVRIANTHLTHLRGADELRLSQIEAIAADPWLRGDAVARLLCGDLNSRPDSAAITWLRSSGAAGWHVLDAYEAAGGPEHRVTFSDRNANVRPDAGDHTIDYIFSLAPSGGEQAAFRDAAVVLDQAAADGVFPSDHFGVAVQVNLGP